MDILIATAEAVPFAKTGGLADVCGALPIALENLGHQAQVIMPGYRSALESGQPIESTGIEVTVPIGAKEVTGEILKSRLPHSTVPVLLVKQDEYFDRAELYGEGAKAYVDNCERFVFFCRAVLESIRLLNLPVDVLHANDWHSALVPAYLRIEYGAVPDYEKIGSLFTIHNLNYQGRFWHWDMLLTGLDWKYFNWHQMEFFGDLNLMKTGLVFSDLINTVSPQYAQEIQSSPLGCGLEGVLRHRTDALTGIINGVDYAVWNPSTDPHLDRNYDASDFLDGKSACKAALATEVGLPHRANCPLYGFIGRLAEQKGIDLLLDVLERSLGNEDRQFVVLGSGEPRYHEELTRLSTEHPQNLAVRLDFSDALAHRIEAGADMFLMPSRFEPCGLNQLYSLRYGSVPIVHSTGGLIDTIANYDASNADDTSANGFRFDEYSSDALDDAMRRAEAVYRNPKGWQRLVQRGMQQDWSWNRSARDYLKLYEATIVRRQHTVCA